MQLKVIMDDTIRRNVGKFDFFLFDLCFVRLCIKSPVKRGCLRLASIMKMGIRIVLPTNLNGLEVGFLSIKLAIADVFISFLSSTKIATS